MKTTNDPNVDRFVRDFRAYIDRCCAQRQPISIFTTRFYKPLSPFQQRILNGFLDLGERQIIHISLRETATEISLAYTTRRRATRQVH